jgi:hypothetical protein
MVERWVFVAPVSVFQEHPDGISDPLEWYVTKLNAAGFETVWSGIVARRIGSNSVQDKPRATSPSLLGHRRQTALQMAIPVLLSSA